MTDARTALQKTDAEQFIDALMVDAQIELRALEQGSNVMDQDFIDALPLPASSAGITPSHLVDALTSNDRHIKLYESMFAEGVDFSSFWRVITISLKARLRYNRHKAMQGEQRQSDLVSLTTSETVSSRHLETARAVADQALREGIVIERIEQLHEEISSREQLLAEEVQKARSLGVGWRAIAAAAGVNHSTAIRRWGSGD